MGIVPDAWECSPRDERSPPWEDVVEKEWEDARMATYAAQVTVMDRGIGRILDALRRNGCYENTVVFFLSDNGGCAEVSGGHPTGLCAIAVRRFRLGPCSIRWISLRNNSCVLLVFERKRGGRPLAGILRRTHARWATDPGGQPAKFDSWRGGDFHELRSAVEQCVKHTLPAVQVICSRGRDFDPVCGALASGDVFRKSR